MQLAGRGEEFAELDIGLAAMTYDDRTILAGFAEENALGFPLLQDVAARHVLAYGVLNEAYPEGDDNYGLPHPGILWIGPHGVLRDKWWIPGYRSRPPLDEVLADIRTQLGP